MKEITFHKAVRINGQLFTVQVEFAPHQDPRYANELTSYVAAIWHHPVLGNLHFNEGALISGDFGGLPALPDTSTMEALTDHAEALSRDLWALDPAYTVGDETTLLAEIARLQDIQKRHHWTSNPWQEASKKLAPLFAEMAKLKPCAS